MRLSSIVAYLPLILLLSDVFFRQKCDTFSRSQDAVFELATRFAVPFVHADGIDGEAKLEAERLMFHELTQVCLWGNSTDLSLLINMTEEQIKSLQSTGGDHLAATEKNILGNHLPELWETVKQIKMSNGKSGAPRPRRFHSRQRWV